VPVAEVVVVSLRFDIFPRIDLREKAKPRFVSLARKRSIGIAPALISFGENGKPHNNQHLKSARRIGIAPALISFGKMQTAQQPSHNNPRTTTLAHQSSHNIPHNCRTTHGVDLHGSGSAR
jgi:hypothetical protein